MLIMTKHERQSEFTIFQTKNKDNKKTEKFKAYMNTNVQKM